MIRRNGQRLPTLPGIEPIEEESVSSRYSRNGCAEKTLGAVYTPPRVASAMVRWAVRNPRDSVLDPSCGEGVFLAAARTHLADCGNKHPACVGVDIDPRVADSTGAVCADFFEWAADASRFDAIVGNPPYIRSHLFPEASRSLAFRGLVALGLRPSRLMSTWAPFAAISVGLLKPGGRLALVVPEELLHVGYAQELRAFLLKRFRRVIVVFPKGDIFPTVQQAVVLLLCDSEKKGPGGLLTLTWEGLEDGPPYPAQAAPVWPWCDKWTHLFLNGSERRLADTCFSGLEWSPFFEYGRVEVGIVTGDNDFFVLSGARAAEMNSEPYLVPIVTGAKDLMGINYTPTDFRDLVRRGRPSFLISACEPMTGLPGPLREYLAQGRRAGVDQRFKCRMRKPWYAVPSVWEADALLLRQAGEFPRLVHMGKRCTSTDTIHRVRWHSPKQGPALTAGFMNTISLVSCELTGRSYGGGVLELMPGEANRIPVPAPAPALTALFPTVDALVRQGRPFEAIRIVDQVVCPRSLATRELDGLQTILHKLINRRKNKHNGRN